MFGGGDNKGGPGKPGRERGYCWGWGWVRWNDQKTFYALLKFKALIYDGTLARYLDNHF